MGPWSGSRVKTVWSLAIGSRILVLCLFVLWRNTCDSYDTSAELSQPCLSGADLVGVPEWETRPIWGQIVGKALERTIVWDGVYYVRIAQCGYEYEQVHAFLPVFPVLMRLLSQTIFSGFISVLGLRATLALSGFVINNIAFILAAYSLYRLTVQVLEDEQLAVYTVALFCFNPASTFYSAIYSESLFSLFSFSGLFHFLNGARWTSIALFSFSSVVRSNGILHAGFILFQALHRVYGVGYRQRRFLAVVPIAGTALFQSTVIAAPFIAFQYYGFSQLCVGEHLPQKRPWCAATIPYLYGFVQSYYWDVGFLRYFQFKQLPNFLLASPMLSLAIFAVGTYVKQNAKLFFSLGLVASSSTQEKIALMPSVFSNSEKRTSKESLEEYKELELLSHKENLRKRKENRQITRTAAMETTCPHERGFHSPAVTCFLFQLCFMVVTAAFIMHVQVATRFLSVSPPIYWYGAYLMKTKRKLGRFMWTIFLCYIGVGSLLFINFYPFT